MAFSGKELMLRHSHGRILAFDLRTNQTAVVLSGLAFPNGIVYEQSTHSLIFSELNRLTIWKYNLTSGHRQPLVQNLFGYADNLKLNQRGELCVGIPATRDPFLEFLNQNPLIRKLLLYLPERLVYAITTKRAGGIKINATSGEIVEYVFGAPTKAAFLTTMLEKNGKTYFGSLKSSVILMLDDADKYAKLGKARPDAHEL